MILELIDTFSAFSLPSPIICTLRFGDRIGPVFRLASSTTAVTNLTLIQVTVFLEYEVSRRGPMSVAYGISTLRTEKVKKYMR
jgi:hypothetical protein